jgi:hypothetical protein
LVIGLPRGAENRVLHPPHYESFLRLREESVRLTHCKRPLLKRTPLHNAQQNVLALL